MTRHTLRQRRAAETFTIRFLDQPFTITVGFNVDGTPHDVFFNDETGQAIESAAHDGALLLSLALQRGIPIETIQRAVARVGGVPVSILGVVVDAIAAIELQQRLG